LVSVLNPFPGRFMISQSRSSPPSSQGNGPGANAPDGQSYLEKVLLIIGLQNRPILTVEEAGRKKEKGKRKKGEKKQ